jgi:hypothetical protein
VRGLRRRAIMLLFGLPGRSETARRGSTRRMCSSSGTSGERVWLMWVGRHAKRSGVHMGGVRAVLTCVCGVL